MGYKKRAELLEQLTELRKARHNEVVYPEEEQLAVSMLKTLITLELKFWMCPVCQGKLKLMPWNDKVDIVYCDNTFCKAYRQPAKTIQSLKANKLLKEEK